VNAAGLILAAGESRRMGSPKALLEFRGETFLDRLIRLFSQHCEVVVVVLGHGADGIRTKLRRSGEAILVLNPNYAQGQLTSMQAGLSRIGLSCDGVVFTLVDHPNILSSTIEALLADPTALLTIPTYKNRRGHPIYFSRDLIPEFLALPPDSQARAVVNRHADRIRYVEADDPGIIQDVDDPEIYRHLIATEPS
jgi:molybdenum cofactor cytidylyltransferase